MNLLTTSGTKTTWSYQLQFNFKYKKSPLLLLRARVLSSDDRRHRCRRLSVHCVSQDEVKSSNQEDKDGVGNGKNDSSWVNLGNVDADWFDNSGDSQKKQGIGGIIGVGLASVFLVVGITAAALSIGKRSSSRPRQIMEPLTEQQELLVTSGEEVLSKEERTIDAKYNAQEDTNLETSDFESAGLEKSTLVSDDTSIREQMQSDVNNLNTVSNPPESPLPDSGDVSYESNTVENLGIGPDVTDFKSLETNDELGTLELSSSTTLLTESEDFDSSNAAKVDSTPVEEPITVENTLVSEPLVFADSSENGVSQTVAFVPQTSVNNQDGEGEVIGSGTVFESESLQGTFTSHGIPAPSLLSAALQVPPGKVLVPAVTDQTQAQALAALQVLKVIESDVQASDLCTRREYARWLVSASSALSRNLILKVYPAMYIENVTELAFDDITPEDPDFTSIQGLAEAGLISSKLSRRDMLSSPDEDIGSFYFHPDSPLSRQDLVTWKMALEKKQLPEADKKGLHQLSGFIDIDRIDPNAFPALVADISAKDQGIVASAFGYTRLFQPDKPVTKGQAAIALATGESAEIVSEELTRIEAESIADKAVSAHIALVAEVEKDINANFEKELIMEREKIDAVQKMAEEAMQEVERLRAEREEDNSALMKQRAAVESEMEVLSKLRHELEEQLEGLMTNKVKISYEKDMVEKLRKETEEENQAIVRLQYELEVERKALSMARAWAEDEAKRVQEHAKVLEEARDRWERQGIKVVVNEDLREEAVADVTWSNVGKKLALEETVDRADSLTDRLKLMAGQVTGKSKEIINNVISKIQELISAIKEWILNIGKRAIEFKDVAVTKTTESVQDLQERAVGVSVTMKEGAKRVVDDCRGGVDKFTQRFKT
ncbi:hypothetical protein KSS87_021680 [Heliosperma pusillum]|nr:hypothetical protein KSS87_010820 [Heliosperma pusillum]KAH9625654.1 hypothetical protein KSS87_021680 [Heliosperma pusillum]